jgi:branched chain amino acid efflux pump
MRLLAILLGGGLITFAIRLSFILLLEKITVPDWLQRSLRLVPVAVFSALIFQLVFYAGETIDLNPLNPRLISGILAGVVAWRTRNVILTLLVGMAVLFVLQALL